MRRNCWIKSNDELGELKSLFAGADNRVSLYFSENPDVREEHLESRLVTTLEETSSVYERRINEDRLRRGLPTLTIDFKHITHSERTNGADIGLVASLSLPREVVLTKAILAQSKKLYRDRAGFSESSSYDEIFGARAPSPQWERLLDITSSSIYLLFGPDRLRINRRVRNFGTQVLTAQNVKGLAESGVPRVTAALAYQRGLDFLAWIVEEFICCNAGDSTDKVIDIARGRRPNFTVHRTIEVSIRGANIDPTLF